MRILFIIFVTIILINSVSFGKDNDPRWENIGQVIQENKLIATGYYAEINTNKLIVINFHTAKEIFKHKSNNAMIIFQISNISNYNSTQNSFITQTILIDNINISNKNIIWSAENDVVFIKANSNIIEYLKNPLIYFDSDIDIKQFYVTVGYPDGKFASVLSTFRGNFSFPNPYNTADNALTNTLYCLESDLWNGSSGSPLLKMNDFNDKRVYGMVSFGTRFRQFSTFYATSSNINQSYLYNQDKNDYSNFKIKSRNFKDSFPGNSQNELYDLLSPYAKKWFISVNTGNSYSNSYIKDNFLPYINIALEREDFIFNNQLFWTVSPLFIRGRLLPLNVLNSSNNIMLGIGSGIETGWFPNFGNTFNSLQFVRLSFFLNVGYNMNFWNYTTTKLYQGINNNIFITPGFKLRFNIIRNMTLILSLGREYLFFKDNTLSDVFDDKINFIDSFGIGISIKLPDGFIPF